MVKTGKGALYDIKSSAREWLSDSFQEFLIADLSILINIVVLEKRLQLYLGWEKSKPGKTLFKFSGLEQIVAVCVQIAEYSSNSMSINSATFGQDHAETVVDLINLDLKADSEQMRHMRFVNLN
jgi:hypothetical protein